MKRLAALLLCCSLPAAAHVLDQYLQVAQISLEPDGVHIELRLVPGAQVADRVFAMLDIDGDGRVSPEEGQIYARRVLRETTLSLDARQVTVALRSALYPSRAEMKEGAGVIRLELAAETPLTAGEHQLTFRNDHLPELGVYLVNTLVPKDTAITIGHQQRDPLQRQLRLAFRVERAKSWWQRLQSAL